MCFKIVNNLVLVTGFRLLAFTTARPPYLSTKPLKNIVLDRAQNWHEFNYFFFLILVEFVDNFEA